mmetsp:Transcript_3738/g.6937  ORF Transcript_3738/g.6937 Transcript_3738/m.6937 type:complete len:760 (-) Transcript_3738:142-2421(-)
MLNCAISSLLVLGLAGIKTVLGNKRVQTPARGLTLSDLPWDDLNAKLNPSTVLLDIDPSSAYRKECLPVVEAGLSTPGPWGPHYMLKNQTSGVCVMNALCGLENCGFDVNDVDATVSDKVLMTYGNILHGAYFSVFDSSNNPSFNLPSKVLFPQVAGDVAAAINFAKEHSLEVSVKNSGHSYTGASTKKSTLHLNMRSYKEYSSSGLTVCSDQQDSAIEQDLSNQACKLAIARNKPAVLHVGGGENWDQVYRNTKAFNEQLDSYKYHVVGGAAGSVSPMGWAWQGGLSGTTAGRIHGFGADQVLQIEMILPSGHHVRFGPVSWEDEDGFLYPRTTKVSGVCYQNLTEEDSSVGTWGPCQNDVNFDDLWFATRGGLGGSWGVVLSVQIQLHHYAPFEFVNGEVCEQTFEFPMAKDTYYQFLIDFLLDPGVVGISLDESNRCGTPTDNFNFYCYGNGAGDVFSTAWSAYIADRNQTLHQDGGISYESINAFAGCFKVLKEFKDVPDFNPIRGGPYEGRVAEDGINPLGTMATQNILVPKKWIIENKDKAVRLMSGNYDAYKAIGGHGRLSLYFAFGGASTSDQANSLSDAHRKAGFMFMALFNMDLNKLGIDVPETAPDIGSFYSELLPDMYDYTDKNSFHGYYGSNHASTANLGPLKSDWTKPCPFDWVQKEREDKCMSLQEAIFGTERLARLEMIKKVIDPNYMFDCNRCVGNNLVKDLTVDLEDDDEENSSAGSGYHGLSAVMVVAMCMWFFVGLMAF